ncbi:MAG: class C beta-lactamase-related serine hydrolase [Acidovorax sp.]|nr:MAG: class C beta-lactamase-related serine hydrolase [Acidovorax sp.]
MKRYWSLGILASLALGTGTTHAQGQPVHHSARSAPSAEQAQDAAAFHRLDAVLAEQLTDVQSAVVMLGGRVVYSFYRDGNPARLHDTQSVAKTAVSVLIGTAIAQKHIASVDQPVTELMPEWQAVNSDPRAARMTLRHLLTMTSGFAVNDAAGTAPPLSPRDAWARPLAHDPGRTFAYDNSVVPMLMAILEKTTGKPVPDYARQHLVEPLGMGNPSYERGLSMRPIDMAKLGQLYLNHGAWNGQQIVPADYVAAATQAQNAGGRPAGLSYGYLWWVVPGQAARPTFMANGWGGQFIWVHPASNLVVAVTSTASADSNQRGHALQLIRQHVFAAAQDRAADGQVPQPAAGGANTPTR